MGGFRRAFLGYRRADVDVAIAERDSVLAQWAQAVGERNSMLARADEEMTCLSRMVLDREREAALLQEQLRAAEERHARSLESLQLVASRLEDIQAQARGQATRIRMKALREAVEVSERAQSLEQRMDFAGHADAPQLQSGDVEVTVGPLSDFSQLLAFQEAAEGLAAVRSVRLERFSEGCATLTVGLGEAADLAAALQKSAALPLELRAATTDAVTFDVSGAADARRHAA